MVGPHFVPKWKLEDPENRRTIDVLKAFVHIEEKRNVMIIYFDEQADVENLKRNYPELKKLLE